jgi:signal transduction histidine kinase
LRIKILLFLVLVFLTNNNILSKSKEVVFYTTSSFVLQKDSISDKYLEAKKYYTNKDYKTSLQKALKILELGHNISRKELVLTNHLVANIFYNTRSNKNAVKYYKKNIKLFDTFINLDGNDYFDDLDLIKSESLLNLGNLYYRFFNVDITPNNTDVLKVYKDSAFYFYNQIDSIRGFSPSILDVKSRAFSNTSVIYMNDTLYKEAKMFANKAIKIHKKLNNKVNEAGALGNLSSIYLSENNYVEAKRIYKEALDLIRNINTDKAVLVREKIYFNLAYNLYKLKDYEAYTYQELSYNIKDSLRDKELRKMIADVSERHNFDVKKNLLLKEEENKRLKDQRTFWLFGIGGFLIILSLLYWVNFYKLRQKNLGLELSQSQLIQNQNLEKVRSDSQVRILNATIDGKETERKQIAETLHDSVSALLSSANLHLQATRSQLKGEAPIEIDKTQEIIKEASQKIRDLSHTLVSSVLLKFGLKYAIKDMADKYSNSQIKIDTRIGETRRYHQDFEIKVYNIIQEFINNILKHSKAEKAIIKLDEVNGKLSLKITDDGVGFDKTKITNKDGLGLNQINARIQMMQGTFNIDSTKKHGTVIKVVLPILEKDGINLV